MSALLKLPVRNDRPEPQVPVELRTFLNKLRFFATTCRATARLDIHAACAVLDANEARAEEAQIKTLLRIMGQALGKEPTFLRPGEDSASFDERWLIAALGAKHAGDEQSYAFLICSRVEPSKRRIFSLFLSGLAEFLTD
ncbi:MAG: hypothetical protein AAF231_02685 [Pseudomonadota bacterium]